MVHKTAPFLLVVAWVALIVSFSAQPGSASGELSGGLTRTIIAFIEIFEPDFSDRFDMAVFHTFIRKSAHFFLYFFLGIWTMNALRTFFSDWFRLVTDATLFALIIAIGDEMLQRFVPGRVMAMNDILIDTAGALTGTLIFALIIFKVKRIPDAHDVIDKVKN